MRFKRLIYILCFAGIFSCTRKNFEKPENLIKKSEMVSIIADLCISQQGIQAYAEQSEDQTILLAKDAVDIMKNHNVNYSQFSESYKYYSLQPEMLDEILDDVKKNLEKRLSKQLKD